jgi:hypothetical protein
VAATGTVTLEVDDPAGEFVRVDAAAARTAMSIKRENGATLPFQESGTAPV